MKAENSAFVFSVALGNFPQVAEVLDAEEAKEVKVKFKGAKSNLWADIHSRVWHEGHPC